MLLHALPNAVGPVANSMALSLSYLLGGVIVVEKIFGYLGLAQLLVDAVSTRDMPLVQTVAMMFCAGCTTTWSLPTWPASSPTRNCVTDGSSETITARRCRAFVSRKRPARIKLGAAIGALIVLFWIAIALFGLARAP